MSFVSYKRYLMIAALVLFVGACSQKKEVFSLAEANECLLESDKSAVWEAVEWIKKADEARTKKDEKFYEYFERAYEPINKLYATSLDDDSITGRKRSAALAWVLIDFSYNNATGSCAKWVLSAQRLGLLEAHQIVADPPEKLRGYLLPPEQQ